MKTCKALTLLALALAAPAWSKDAPQYSPEKLQTYADMRALEEYAREGKREFVAAQLTLTDEEARGFWPAFDSHQRSLSELNRRRLENIAAYARVWNDGTLDDGAADRLATEAIDIEKDEAALIQHTYRKLKGIVPAMKAVRYLQLESKLRALARFELAAEIPVAE